MRSQILRFSSWKTQSKRNALYLYFIPIKWNWSIFPIFYCTSKTKLQWVSLQSEPCLNAVQIAKRLIMLLFFWGGGCIFYSDCHSYYIGALVTWCMSITWRSISVKSMSLRLAKNRLPPTPCLWPSEGEMWLFHFFLSDTYCMLKVWSIKLSAWPTTIIQPSSGGDDIFLMLCQPPKKKKIIDLLAGEASHASAQVNICIKFPFRNEWRWSTYTAVPLETRTWITYVGLDQNQVACSVLIVEPLS